MNPYFNQELPVFQFIYKMVLVILIGVLGMFCSIFVITAGPAWTAMYDTIQKSVIQERGSVLKTFFESIRKNFKESFLCVVILLLYGAVVGTGVYFCTVLGQKNAGFGFYRYMIGAFLLPALMILPYLFPLLSRFVYTVKEYFIMSYYLCIRHFASTCLFCILIYGSLALVILVPRLRSISFALPGIICVLVSVKMEKILSTLVSKDKEDDT